ncbi:uncharacterized protein LOC143018977 [Oratosquilla oratoria]|uniref:uncharacterized protein LOC143018977 n=1 Tax=Oratosquilla oratoria TaxID=337810 RepID=UPI003F777E30
MAAPKIALWILTALFWGSVVLAQPSNDYAYYDYEYTYGDTAYPYGPDNEHDDLQASETSILNSGSMTMDLQAQPSDPLVVSRIRSTEPHIPLCCDEGQVYNVSENCTTPPASFGWRPHLNGAPDAHFVGSGFPKCDSAKSVVFISQKEVFFISGRAFLPRYIHLDPLPSSRYCVAKVYDESDVETCEEHQTKVYTCLPEGEPHSPVMWMGVGVAHCLLFLTLLSFFTVKDLRCLQGQYMIFFLISLFIYNLCLLPGSVIILQISTVACVSLGAVKYFFFCGSVLWFNVICFDVWRTLKNKRDVGNRMSFLLYSVYTWVFGVVLTTVVLILPYTRGLERDETLMEPLEDKCKLKLEVHILLQLVQTFLMVINLVLLLIASCNISKYNKFGNGLPRAEASFCLKQGWKLFLIMLAHTLFSIPHDILNITVVDTWRYVLLESVAIFGVFAYRRFVMKSISGLFCNSACYRSEDDASVVEKDQLTNVH